MSLRWPATIAMLCILRGSVAAAADESDTLQAKFVGTWEHRTGDRLTVVTWDADGTWRSKTTEGTRLVFALSGVWWVKDGEHHGVCLRSSDPTVLRGEDEANEIVEVTDAHYTVKDRRGNPKKYERVNTATNKPAAPP